MGKPKTYEMPSGANCTLANLRAIAGIEHMDIHFKYFGLAVTVGNPPNDLEYVLHHHYSSIMGGSVEFRASAEQDANEIIAALIDVIGGKPETIKSGGKLITTIKPNSKVSLTELIGFATAYSPKVLKDPKIKGYRIENLPPNLHKKVVEVGLPLQEEQPK